ncbi:MAG: GNAT family N-acetyltransferase [Candidatus Latescibacteria bacterium]|nr:GNAT family N-acetyltransferase [Candidatus Latescibacterota bacterium]
MSRPVAGRAGAGGAPTSTPGAPTATRIDSESAFARLKPEWNALLASSRTRTIFLTWEWISAWWEAYRAGKELYVIRVDAGERLIGIAPLYRRRLRRALGIGWRVLQPLGDGSYDSDYLDWVAEPGREGEVVGEVAEFLDRHRHDWEMLLVNEIPDTSPHLPYLRHEGTRRRWISEETPVPCARVRLPGSWDEYLALLKPRQRTKVRSLLRDVDGSADARFDRCQDREDLAPRLESLFDLHNRRWRAQGRPGVFEEPAKRAFYAAMSERFLARDWLRLYSLSVSGRYAAHQFCFEYDGVLYLLQEGYDPTFAGSEVGNALRGLVFRDCIARGLRAYDFLAGVTSHKLAWGSSVHRSVRLTLARPTLKSSLSFRAARLKAALLARRRAPRGEAAP